MMSRTHIAVGVAVGLAVAQTGSVPSCVAAIVGGSIGGVIADCDITPSRAHRDALVGRLIVAGIAALALALDYWHGAGVCDYLVDNLGVRFIAGVAAFALLTFAGAHTDHRSFTHSIFAMAAFCAAVYLACEPLLPFFAAGYASHLALDLTNTQTIRLFWPFGKGVGLGLCHAKGAANSALLVLGIAAATLVLACRLAPLIGVTVGMA